MAKAAQIRDQRHSESGSTATTLASACPPTPAAAKRVPTGGPGHSGRIGSSEARPCPDCGLPASVSGWRLSKQLKTDSGGYKTLECSEGGLTNPFQLQQSLVSLINTEMHVPPNDVDWVHEEGTHPSPPPHPPRPARIRCLRSVLEEWWVTDGRCSGRTATGPDPPRHKKRNRQPGPNPRPPGVTRP